MADVLVEGFAPDAVSLARLLASRGDRVRLAGPGRPSPDAMALAPLGVTVDGGVDLDLDVRVPERAYLDVWTPEVAPRVARLRAAGTTLTSLSDLLLAESPIPTIGVTGTAGKSTTAAFLAVVLERAGLVSHSGTTSRPGQRWATEELLPLLDGGADGMMLLELTSSHLAFCDTPPHVAVVTCFWPDHVELHGSVEAYLSAKQRIVRGQQPGDRVVFEADDPALAGFAELTPAARFPFSLSGPVEQGAFVRGDAACVRSGGEEVVVGETPSVKGGRRRAALAALAAALAAGAEPQRLVGSLVSLHAPPHRARRLGEVGGTELVDDSAAATATKAAATLRQYPAGSVVVVAGGALESVGLAVQASAQERRLLGEALDVLARAARVVVVFGPAGASIAAPLRARRATVVEVATLDEAVALGLERAAGATALVVSPMFPLAQEERERVESLLVAAG